MGAMSQMLVSMGGRNVVNIVISADTQNYVLNTAKVSGYQAGNTDVTLTINSGIYVGSTSTAGIGLDVDTSWNAADRVSIVNNGFVVGAGGNANAGAGGPALRVQRATTINNVSGTIGGGGGAGTQGGPGTFVCNCIYSGYLYGGGGGGGGQGYSGGSGAAGTSLPSGTGGSGGSGTKTSPGAGGASSGGGSGAGSSGGTLGVASAGAAGNCTTTGSNANITWTNTGTRLGTIA